MTTLMLSIALAWGAPATVLRHDVAWTLASDDRLVTDTTWVIRIDDPAACVAGLHAPAGLDGAEHNGARVLEDLLLVPAGTPAGAEFTLHSKTTGKTWQKSGAFDKAPDLPLVTARVSIDVPRGQPLSVWHDDAAWTELATDRSAVVSWEDIPAGLAASLVWSSWPDWLTAGDRLLEVTDKQLGSREDMGRELAAGLGAIGVGTLAERVVREVSLDPGGGWDDARSVRSVVTSGHGTAAERGLVLINLLRLSGYEAWPGGYRTARNQAPSTLPAPALLQRPIVAIEWGDRVDYIDPAADHASVPSIPADLYGGTAWHAGDLPVPVGGDALVDGEVRLVTEAKVTRTGDMTWRTDLVAVGAALQRIREYLAPLPVDGRREAIGNLLRVARPNPARLDINVSGIEQPSAELRITVSGSDTGRFRSVAGGMVGSVPPVLAPAMARWLPPNIRVEERMAVSGPADLEVLATTEARSEFRAEAQVSRVQLPDRRRSVFVTEVLRPYRTTSAGWDARAQRFLDGEANTGPEVWLFPRSSPTLIKQVRAASELSLVDRAVLEALVHLAADNGGAASRAIRKAAKGVPLADVIAGLQHLRRPDFARLWSIVAYYGNTPEDVLAVAQAMLDAGLTREGWLLAYSVHDSSVPEVRLQALFMMLEHQGAQPDPEADSEAAEAWRKSDFILEWIAEIAPDDPRLVRRKAALALESGAVATAELLLEDLLARGPDPAAEVLLAQAAAQAGVPLHEIRERVDRAVASAPFDHHVAAEGAATLSAVGDLHRALDHALAAARLAYDDLDRWEGTVDAALDVGDLHAALYAARRASDIAEADPEAAALLLEMSALAGDETNAKLARKRANNFTDAGREWPIPVEQLILEIRPRAVFALLQGRDAEVVRSAPLLLQRARLRLARGLLDEAARDGMLLERMHGEPAGRALAFSAIVGRQQSSTNAAALYSAAAQSTDAALVALEHDLIIGTNDVRKRAEAIDNDRARQIAAALADPLGLSGAAWPADLTTPRDSPRGMRLNTELGGVAG
ncbi:MAG: hypothetical protein ACI8PZ_002116, partial [Myxococcota bacterium]